MESIKANHRRWSKSSIPQMMFSITQSNMNSSQVVQQSMMKIYLLSWNFFDFSYKTHSFRAQNPLSNWESPPHSQWTPHDYCVTNRLFTSSGRPSTFSSYRLRDAQLLEPLPPLLGWFLMSVFPPWVSAILTSLFPLDSLATWATTRPP